MRAVIITLTLLALLPTLALADSGHAADLQMVVDFGDMFSQFGPLMEQEGAPPEAGTAPAMPSRMEMSGELAWTESYLRLDLEPFDGTHESTILDIDNKVTYKLDHVNKLATKIELADFDSQFASAMDMPDPEAMAADWEAFLTSIEGLEGAVVNELAPRTISGYNCKGFSFVVDMSQAFAMPDSGAETGEDEELANMLGAMMSAMGNYSGEFWVAEEISMPISMTLHTMMMDYSWGMANVRQADIPASRFQVPADYEIVELQLPDMSEMPDFADLERPAPQAAPE